MFLLNQRYYILISELNVTISVSYNPPPGFTRVPNEYRAASGPVIVTCTANGGTGSISYQWSSDCRNCDFQREMSSMITRGAVHSGDTGTHTCTATTAKGVGNASINFTVKGEHTLHQIKSYFAIYDSIYCDYFSSTCFQRNINRISCLS